MKKAYLNLKSALKTVLMAVVLTIALPAPKAHASVYSLASKTMELVDPDGRNMVKFILTVGTATVIYHGIDEIDRRVGRFCRKHKNAIKGCSAAIIAYTFWNTVLPKGKK